MNAYLINKLQSKELQVNGQDMDLLYLNLNNLIKQANTSLAIQRIIFQHALEIDPVLVQDY